MNRRSLLQMLGLAAVAPVLPSIPAAAKVQTPPFKAVWPYIVAKFQDPLHAIAFTKGANGERYRAYMPATVRYLKHKGRPWADDLVVEFTASFTGTVESVEIGRGDDALVTVYRDAFETPYWTSGMLVRVTIGIDNHPSEAV